MLPEHLDGVTPYEADGLNEDIQQFSMTGQTVPIHLINSSDPISTTCSPEYWTGFNPHHSSIVSDLFVAEQLEKVVTASAGLCSSRKPLLTSQTVKEDCEATLTMTPQMIFESSDDSPYHTCFSKNRFIGVGKTNWSAEVNSDSTVDSRSSSPDFKRRPCQNSTSSKGSALSGRHNTNLTKSMNSLPCPADEALETHIISAVPKSKRPRNRLSTLQESHEGRANNMPSKTLIAASRGESTCSSVITKSIQTSNNNIIFSNHDSSFSLISPNTCNSPSLGSNHIVEQLTDIIADSGCRAAEELAFQLASELNLTAFIPRLENIFPVIDTTTESNSECSKHRMMMVSEDLHLSPSASPPSVICSPSKTTPEQLLLPSPIPRYFPEGLTLWRECSIGQALVEVINDMFEENILTRQMCEQLLAIFDRVMVHNVPTAIKTRMNFKITSGQIDRYKNLDGTWVIYIRNLRVRGRGATMGSPLARVVATESSTLTRAWNQSRRQKRAEAKNNSRFQL